MYDSQRPKRIPPLTHTYLRKEGVHVTGLELELCVSLGIGGVAPLLKGLEVLGSHIALGQVKRIDESQDVPGRGEKAAVHPPRWELPKG